ncbi:MAG: hypothetical protein ABIG68_01955 [Acidobacteriota bacterium]
MTFMLRILIDHRALVNLAVACACGAYGWIARPFPAGNLILGLVHDARPVIFQAIRWTYATMWFTTPYIVTSLTLSLAYIFLSRQRQIQGRGRLPAYPIPAARPSLVIVVGELHHAKKPIPSRNPCWLVIPGRGLYTGMAIVGAIGSGKTSCCMYPFAEQVFAFKSNDPGKRIGGLVMGVKGDFCHKVREILRRHGRDGDYIEMSLDSPYRYNPLRNDLDAYALVYSIASLLNNLFGRGKEPFWQQAYTNLVKSIDDLRFVRERMSS